MKMTNWKLATLAMAATLFAFTSCSDNDEPNNGGGVDAGSTLTGELTKDLTLKSGNTYYLSGGYHVKSGTTLTIQPGVNIIAKDDDIVDYILIEQGAKIDAQGTASSPIVMTSEKKEAGAWGGIHICGYAHTNLGATSKSEIGDATYGGTNDADNSGTLRYIRLEYTGYAFSEEKEANGVSFYGVGNGTTVEYLQAYKGSDDGFEFFGGSVNVKYLVATDCSDDSFDWTEGWNGYGQFLVAYQGDKATIGYDCDCLIEADNNGKNAAATPVSAPVLANMTLVGNSSTANKRGIRLRAGTQAKIYNTLVKGKTSCLTTETVETETAGAARSDAASPDDSTAAVTLNSAKMLRAMRARCRAGDSALPGGRYVDLAGTGRRLIDQLVSAGLLFERGLARWSICTPSTTWQWMQLWLMQRDLLTPSTMPTTVSTFTCNTRLPHFGHMPWIVIMM